MLALLLGLDVLCLENKSQFEIWNLYVTIKLLKMIKNCDTKVYSANPEYFNNEVQSIDRID